MNKLKLTSIVTLALGLQLLVSINLSNAAMMIYYKDNLLPGITIENVDVGGLSYKQAVTAIKDTLPWPSPNSQIMLVDFEGQSTNVRYGDIGYTADYDATVKKAFDFSHQLKSLENSKELYNTINNGHNMPLLKKVDHEKFTVILNKLANKYYIPSKNAQVSFNEDKVTIIQDIQGKKLDVDATIKSLLKLDKEEYRLSLEFKTLEPDVSISDLAGINSLLGVFATQFDESKKERSHNILLASKLINNYVLKPHSIFSLNKILGPRTGQLGYLQAPVIVDNKLVNDYGGGVCQVATTLYNAVLLSGLTVVERVPHTLPVPYAPKGQDATIAGDVIDFKFLNNTDNPVVITSQIQQGKLLVSVFGHRDGVPSRLIKLETERSISKPTKKYIIEKHLEPGQVVIRHPGKDGYLVKTYAVVYENGQRLERKLVSQTSTNPESEIIAIGPINNKTSVKK